MGEAAVAADRDDRTVVFTYGTLKQGFSNHVLMQEMIRAGEASFLGPGRTADRLPLVCGPYSVPFLINLPGAGDRVRGELYAVSRRALSRMDELEGTSRGHYVRLPISVSVFAGKGEGDGGYVVQGEAYYAHPSYAEELWRRNGEKGFSAYSAVEAMGYVKRKDRPQDITFLGQIRIFISTR